MRNHAKLENRYLIGEENGEQEAFAVLCIYGKKKFGKDAWEIFFGN